MRVTLVSEFVRFVTAETSPSALVAGEVRAEECPDLLLALNAGLPGMASMHANSAREALVKACTLPLLAGENVGSRFVVPTVAAAVDRVVHITLCADGVRRVSTRGLDTLRYGEQE